MSVRGRIFTIVSLIILTANVPATGDWKENARGIKISGGEPRIVDGIEDGIERVDMGADEFYRSPADFDRNEIVNFIDYRVLASAWQTTPNDNDYNDICDLADNNSIDNNDLDVFCDDWLWEPAWVQPIETMMMMGGAMGGGYESGPGSNNGRVLFRYGCYSSGTAVSKDGTGTD